jgi:hypothetical protein
MPGADRIETSSHGYKDGRPVVIAFALLTSSPNGIELLAARKIDVYATNLFEVLTYCRARA